MKDIFVLTICANNSESIFEFAFHNLNEAQNFREYVDRNKGASSKCSTIHILRVYDKAIQLMEKTK